MQFLSQDHGCDGWRGEMATRIRAFDWSLTELGPFDLWPPSLRMATQFLLASPVPLVMLWGRPGYMIYNDAYSLFAGGRHPYLLGSPVELGWPEVADFNRNVVDTCLAGGTLSYSNLELVLLRNGVPEDVWMDLYYSPVPGDDGSPAGVMAIVVETTGHVLSERAREGAESALRQLTRNLEQRVEQEVRARSEAEEKLRQSQKLEAIGGLTGGVAHDFNNVLQVIAGNLHLLGRQQQGNAPIQRRVAAALAAVERGAKLSSQLLAFARRQPLSPGVYNLRRLYDGLGELMLRAMGETVNVRMQVPEQPWSIHVDRNQLENAVLNLAINARDAMNGEGELLISADNVVLGREFCAGKDLSPGDYVRLAVRDSGAGMSPATLAQAFEPFFTTKPDGHGTGLGLSMVFGFVRQSAGHVEISSVQGQGTTVQMYFPRSEGAESVEEAPLAVAVANGEETILVVEDDDQVRATAAELLEQSGYRVITAENGDVAMRFLLDGLRVDLIFTDVVMPGQVKSADLATWAQARTPPLPVLFASGHTRDIISRNYELAPHQHLLRKPYGPDALMDMVRRVLQAEHG